MRELARMQRMSERVNSGQLRRLASLNKVNRWMDSPWLVDPQQPVFERTHTWMSLRLLHGFDLPEFLVGSRHAYLVTSELLQAARWEELRELVHPDVLESMEETFEVAGHPYVCGPTDGNGDGDINILSAVLSSARTSGDDADVAHMDVKFRTLQGVTLHDLQHGDELHEVPRLQESTWTFEGVRFPPPDGDASATSNIDWQVTDIAWQVWEMAEAPMS